MRTTWTRESWGGGQPGGWAEAKKAETDDKLPLESPNQTGTGTGTEDGGDQEAPVEDPEPDAQDDSIGNQEVEALRTLLAEEKIIQSGQKAMMRSKRKKREKLDRYNKYIKQYRYLASIGDRKMGKMKVEANKPGNKPGNKRDAYGKYLDS